MKREKYYLLVFIFSIFLLGILHNFNKNVTIIDSEKVNILEPNLITKLDTPQNVKIDENFIASWDVVENAAYYYVRVYIDGTFYLSNGLSVRLDNSYGVFGFIEDGKVKADLSSSLLERYKKALSLDSNTGQAVSIQITVTSKASSDSDYVDSSESWPPSNSVYYSPYGSTVVDSLSVTPSDAIIGVGRNYNLNASVLPEDSYYSLKWTSANSKIASINKDGKLSGEKEGNTTITVNANGLNEEINVSVYNVETQDYVAIELENSTLVTSEPIVEKAYDTLENIFLRSDITGTDVKNVDDVLSEIINAATTVNTFNVKKNYEKKSIDDYSFLENEIKEKYGDMIVLTAFKTNLELFYQDESNIKHHILNIVDFDYEMQYTVPIDEVLPNLSYKKDRKFVLLRYYNGELEEIDSDIQQLYGYDQPEIFFNTDKFADFILLYKDVDIPVESIDVDNSMVEIPVGSTETISLSFTPNNATNVRFSSVSSNPSIATVKDRYNIYNGDEEEDVIISSIEITGVSEGTTIVTIESEDGHITKQVNVEVKKAVESITINNPKESIEIGDQLQLSFELNPQDAYDKIEWYSSNNKVATVDQNGLVTGISAGVTTIEVCSSIPWPYGGVCDSFYLNVGAVPVYRMYNPYNGEHLYTPDAHEVEVLYKEHGWGKEGIGWYSSSSGTPVYRLYNAGLANHLYTSDANEIRVLTENYGWVLDNNGEPVMYSINSSGIPIYRVYNESLRGLHHLTTDENEYNVLPQYGWQQEGISMYASKIGVPETTNYYK